MFDSAPTPLSDQLPADAYWHLIRNLRLTLPPPPGDGPEDLLRRDHAAIANVAALAPANAAEANLAAQFVAASEQWMDCLRLARAPETTPEWAGKCRAQALAMMRQANSALRLLLRMQEARRKLEADNHACDRLAWTEHCATRLMAEALEQPAKSPAPGLASPDPVRGPGEHAAAVAASPQAAEPASAPAHRTGASALASRDEGQRPSGQGTARPAPRPQSGPLAEAEHHAIPYPERAEARAA